MLFSCVWVCNLPCRRKIFSCLNNIISSQNEAADFWADRARPRTGMNLGWGAGTWHRHGETFKPTAPALAPAWFARTSGRLQKKNTGSLKKNQPKASKKTSEASTKKHHKASKNNKKGFTNNQKLQIQPTKASNKNYFCFLRFLFFFLRSRRWGEGRTRTRHRHGETFWPTAPALAPAG